MPEEVRREILELPVDRIHHMVLVPEPGPPQGQEHVATNLTLLAIKCKTQS